MQIGFFSEENRMEKLSKLGDSLVRLDKVIGWEQFRSILEKATVKEHKGLGGRPPYDVILMFKILILQRLYNLSDDQMEFQINDRMSFMRFLGLGLGNNVPDAKTIWLFRDTLMKSGVIETLFHNFNKTLNDAGIITREGSIVDATFVDAPRQRNTREENKRIKEGEVPEEWQTSENAHKFSQKDTDARWAIKNNERHYGYKNHVKVDADSKIITEYTATSANVHDSQVLSELITDEDKILYADSAYTGEELHAKLPKTLEIKVHEKGYRSKPLTEEQKENNRLKSKIRARVEHVFGFMTGSMNGITVRSIGIDRAIFNIGLTNLLYNICRYEILKRVKFAKG